MCSAWLTQIKSIEVVVDSLEAAKITRRVVALKPIGNVKGAVGQ